MNLYYEEIDDFGDITKIWNFCHPSGFAGKVVEYYDYTTVEFMSQINFIKNGKLHRDTKEGPAVIIFSLMGGQLSAINYVEGVNVSAVTNKYPTKDTSPDAVLKLQGLAVGRYDYL